MNRHSLTLVLLVTSICLGCLLLGLYFRMRTSSVQQHTHSESGHGPMQMSDTSGNLSEQSANAEENDRTQRRVGVSTSISVPGHHHDSPGEDSSAPAQQSAMSQPNGEETSSGTTALREEDYIDANGDVTDWEMWCLARMHKHGWYKPEDVPIVYEKPNGGRDGVFLWVETVGNGGGPPQFPPHVEARSKELGQALARAMAIRDGREVTKITKELNELNRPFASGGTMVMGLDSIPPSWRPYFDDIWKYKYGELVTSLRN